MIRLLLLLILACNKLALANPIPDFNAVYSVKMNGISAGDQTRSLTTQADGSRVFTSTSKATGIFSFFRSDVVTETSTFFEQQDKIIPVSYLYQRTGGKKDKYLSLKFDWQNKTVAIDDHKHPWRLNISENTLDKLVYQIKLMSDLNSEQQQFLYRIAGGGKLSDYDIRIVDKQVLRTPFGKLNTVKLKRFNQHKKRQTILWSAIELLNLPVKIEHHEKDGNTFTATLKKLEGIRLKLTQPAPQVELSND